MEYKNKYFKYKNKYLYLKKLFGGYFGKEIEFDQRDEHIIGCNDIQNDFFKASVAGINYYTEEKFLTLGSEGTIRQKIFEISKNVCVYFNIWCENIINHFKTEFSFVDGDFEEEKMKLNIVEAEKYTVDNDYMELLDEMLSDTLSYMLRYLVIIIHLHNKYSKPLPTFINKDYIAFFYFQKNDDLINKLFKQRDLTELDKSLPVLNPIFNKLNEIINDTSMDINDKNTQVKDLCKEILIKGHDSGEIHIISGYYFEINYNYQLLTDRRSNCSVYNVNTLACLYKKYKGEFNDVGKNVYFNEEQLSRLRKFKVYNNLIDTDELHKKEIGITLISMNKNKIFFNKFYKRGFLSATGPSGSIPYFVCLYLMIDGLKGVSKIKISDFILMCFFYMGIRCDHSLFEMILTIPWNIFSIKTPLIISEPIEPELYDFDLNNVNEETYLQKYFEDKKISGERKERLIDSIKRLNEEWNKFNQTKAWVLLQQIVHETGENDFKEIKELLNDRINYIKKICK